MNLWDVDTEKQFFLDALGRFATPEKLFYSLKSGKFAYVPKGCDTEGQTLQSRNALIGNFTETWAKNLFSPIARKFGLYAVNNVECPDIGLVKKSEADLALCTTDSKIQTAKNIKLVFEIKMSIVSNYKYNKTKGVELVGDYKTHQGNPSLLRSDSMLKAIGKSINIRVSGIESAKIPIVVLGNSPITNNYIHKVDFLKTAGVIQYFWSLNPKPTQSDFIEKTDNLGFQTIQKINHIESLVNELLSTKLNYFSSMISQDKLGEFIRISYQEPTDEAKAEKFLSLIRGI
jgi:proteasome lid subunit RPN8/RPN11